MKNKDSRPYPALCRDCKWSISVEQRQWELRCINPKVNASDSWALSAGYEMWAIGTDCRAERDKTSWFSKCGMKGKLWETK
jgi:hypothetical protein